MWDLIVEREMLTSKSDVYLPQGSVQPDLLVNTERDHVQTTSCSYNYLLIKDQLYLT